MKAQLDEKVNKLRSQVLSFSNEGMQIALDIPDTNDVKDTFGSVITSVAEQQDEIGVLHSDIETTAAEGLQSQGKLLAWTLQCVNQLKEDNARLQSKLTDANKQIKNLSYNIQGYVGEDAEHGQEEEEIVVEFEQPPIITIATTKHPIPTGQEEREGERNDEGPSSLFPTENGADIDSSGLGLTAKKEGANNQQGEIRSTKKQKDPDTIQEAKDYYDSVPQYSLPNEAAARWRWAIRKILRAQRTKRMKLSLTSSRLESKHTFGGRLERIEARMHDADVETTEKIEAAAAMVGHKVDTSVYRLDTEISATASKVDSLNANVDEKFEDIEDKFHGVKDSIKDLEDKMQKQAEGDNKEMKEMLKFIERHLQDMVKMDVKEVQSNVLSINRDLDKMEVDTDKLYHRVEKMHVMSESLAVKPGSAVPETTQEAMSELTELLQLDTTMRECRAELNFHQSTIDSLKGAFIAIHEKVSTMYVHFNHELVEGEGGAGGGNSSGGSHDPHHLKRAGTSASGEALAINPLTANLVTANQRATLDELFHKCQGIDGHVKHIETVIRSMERFIENHDKNLKVRYDALQNVSADMKELAQAAAHFGQMRDDVARLQNELRKGAEHVTAVQEKQMETLGLYEEEIKAINFRIGLMEGYLPDGHEEGGEVHSHAKREEQEEQDNEDASPADVTAGKDAATSSVSEPEAPQKPDLPRVEEPSPVKSEPVSAQEDNKTIGETGAASESVSSPSAEKGAKEERPKEKEKEKEKESEPAPVETPLSSPQPATAATAAEAQEAPSNPRREVAVASPIEEREAPTPSVTQVVVVPQAPAAEEDSEKVPLGSGGGKVQLVSNPQTPEPPPTPEPTQAPVGLTNPPSMSAKEKRDKEIVTKVGNRLNAAYLQRKGSTATLMALENKLRPLIEKIVDSNVEERLRDIDFSGMGGGGGGGGVGGMFDSLYNHEEEDEDLDPVNEAAEKEARIVAPAAVAAPATADTTASSISQPDLASTPAETPVVPNTPPTLENGPSAPSPKQFKGIRREASRWGASMASDKSQGAGGSSPSVDMTPFIEEMMKLKKENAKLSKDVYDMKKEKLNEAEAKRIFHQLHDHQKEERHEDHTSKRDLEMMQKQVYDMGVEMANMRNANKKAIADLQSEFSETLHRVINTAADSINDETKDSYLNTKSLCLSCGRSSSVRGESESRPTSPGFYPTLGSHSLPGPDVYRGGFRLPVRVQTPPGLHPEYVLDNNHDHHHDGGGLQQSSVETIHSSMRSSVVKPPRVRSARQRMKEALDRENQQQREHSGGGNDGGDDASQPSMHTFSGAQVGSGLENDQVGHGGDGGGEQVTGLRKPITFDAPGTILPRVRSANSNVEGSIGEYRSNFEGSVDAVDIDTQSFVGQYISADDAGSQITTADNGAVVVQANSGYQLRITPSTAKLREKSAVLTANSGKGRPEIEPVVSFNRKGLPGRKSSKAESTYAPSRFELDLPNNFLLKSSKVQNNSLVPGSEMIAAHQQQYPPFSAHPQHPAHSQQSMQQQKQLQLSNSTNMLPPRQLLQGRPFTAGESVRPSTASTRAQLLQAGALNTLGGPRLSSTMK